MIRGFYHDSETQLYCTQEYSGIYGEGSDLIEDVPFSKQDNTLEKS